MADDPILFLAMLGGGAACLGTVIAPLDYPMGVALTIFGVVATFAALVFLILDWRSRR